jgi:hypothetical protein
VGVDVAYRDFGTFRPYSISDLNDLITPYKDEWAEEQNDYNDRNHN